MNDRLRRPVSRRRADRAPGQALVEFSIAVIPFLLLLMGVLDLGRAIYAMNATSEAAREVARATSVHRCANSYGGCADLGTSVETQDAIATQRVLIPNLQFDPSVDIDCVDATDAVIADPECKPSTDTDRFIRVHVRSTFSPVTPLLSIFGNHTFESWARIRLS